LSRKEQAIAHFHAIVDGPLQAGEGALKVFHVASVAGSGTGRGFQTNAGD
jgi:hypothetical protein